MLLVTGGAGFVGSHVVAALNARGVDDVCVVDDLTRGEQFEHLAGCRLADYLDREELARALERRALDGAVTAILHQGAITDTLEQDGRRLMAENFTLGKALLDLALRTRVPLVYASSAAVYGAGRSSTPAPEHERPVNPYGWSKLVLDQHVRRRLREPDARAGATVVGLRYFNVYGPNETHKGRMASMVHQLWRQLASTGVARLFEGSDGFGPGEQRRDHVYVEDVAALVVELATGPARHGVVNVGTGRARSFNEVAQLLIERLGRGAVEYVPFPPGLRARYQSFTEADLGPLRALGVEPRFRPLEDGLGPSLARWTAWAAARVDAPSPAGPEAGAGR